MSFISTALLFLVVLCLLVMAHELGHFVTAKLAGIKVQEFGFGFPPRLFGVRRGETLYSLNLLPLGGFVKMLGENGQGTDPREFASKSWGVRAGILIAGSAMNLILAPLILAAAFMVGAPVPCHTCQTVQVRGLIPGGAGETADLRPGDVIQLVDGEVVRSADDVRRVVRANVGRPLSVQVRREQLTEIVSITPREVASEQHGAIGVQLGPETVIVRHSFWEALPLGIRGVGHLLSSFPEALGSVVRGEVGAELSGPIGIASGTGRAAEAGWNYLLAFVAFISLNLAVFNMLPLPGLDGGRLVFVLIEAARRGQRVRPRIEGMIHLGGMVLLLTLVAFASVQDVRRLLGG